MDIIGLPLHPLIVHAAVVLVPIAALAALLMVAMPRLRATYGALTVAVAVAAAISAVAARFTGEWFLDGLGLRGSARVLTHTTWGVWTPWPALLLAIVMPVFLWAAAHRDHPRAPAAFAVSAALTVIAAVASLGLIAVTGHSGAAAVWGP